MNFHRAFDKIRGVLFPSEQQLILRKWQTDRGDYELRFNYDLGEESIALDLGGYEGKWTNDIYTKYRCRIYVFEPVGSFADQIRRRFAENDKIEVCQHGLGASTRQEIIHLSVDGSSVFGSSAASEEITIIDAKTWIEENLNGRINLIKINIEGGEYELLSRLIETNLVERIDNIQVQFHRISGASMAEMRSIQRALRRTHRPTYQYEFVWENWARL